METEARRRPGEASAGGRLLTALAALPRPMPALPRKVYGPLALMLPLASVLLLLAYLSTVEPAPLKVCRWRGLWKVAALELVSFGGHGMATPDHTFASRRRCSVPRCWN